MEFILFDVLRFFALKRLHSPGNDKVNFVYLARLLLSLTYRKQSMALTMEPRLCCDLLSNLYL